MSRPINPGRLILAALIAPMIGAFVTVTLATILDTGVLDDLSGYFTFIGAGGGLGTLLVGWPTMLIVGLPLHVWLCQKNQRHWTRYGGLGALGGLVPVTVFGLFEGGFPIQLVLLGVCAGALTAVLFHVIRGPHLALTEPANPTT